MLSVPEEFAGQMMKCPLCGGTFPTPSLPGAPLGGFSPPAPPPAPALPEPYALAPAPVPTLPPPSDRPKLAPLPDLPASITTEPALAPPRKKERSSRDDGDEQRPRKVQPPEPVTPGEYKHGFSFGFDLGIITWLPPALLTVVFLLSFFPWSAEGAVSHNLWECAISIGVRFIFYVILFVLAWLLSIASVVFGARLVPEPPFVQALGPWRHAIAGGVSVLAFLFLAIAYIEWVFLTQSPMTVWMRIAVRFHLLAILSALLELWLDSRQKRRAPPPRIDVRW
jgi:hypothetical protein